MNWLMHTRKRYILCRLLPISVLGILPLSGCYQHVVSAKGPGSGDYTIYEPNVPDPDAPLRIPILSDLVDLMFGPKEPDQNQR